MDSCVILLTLLETEAEPRKKGHLWITAIKNESEIVLGAGSYHDHIT